MANKMQVYWRVDTTGLNFIEKHIPQITNDAVKTTIEEIARGVKENWSSSSPSAPGSPPAVVTGYLDSSVQIFRKDLAGRFSTLLNAVTWGIRVGAEYGAALEFGNPVTGAAPRPFLRPAIKAAEDLLGQKISIGFRQIETAGGLNKAAYLARRARG